MVLRGLKTIKWYQSRLLFCFWNEKKESCIQRENLCSIKEELQEIISEHKTTQVIYSTRGMNTKKPNKNRNQDLHEFYSIKLNILPK